MTGNASSDGCKLLCLCRPNRFDLPCHEIVYEDKGKVRKWNPMSKKHKHGAVVAALASGSTGCASAVGIKGSNGTAHNANCGGSPTENLRQHVDPGFLFHLQELKDFLMSEKSKYYELYSQMQYGKCN